MKPSPLRMIWNAEGVVCVRDGAVLMEFPWGAIRRIAYLTEDTGLAITDDHFLALHTDGGLTLISLGVAEAIALSEHIKNRFDCVFGPKGSLAHVTTYDSVIVWPPDEAGRDIYDQITANSRSNDLRVQYCLAHPDGFIDTVKLLR